MSDPAPVSASGYAIYTRLSRVQTGRGKRRRNEYETVERQEAIIRKWAAEQGIPVSERHVYPDNDLSAWKSDGKRGHWNLMLAAAARREFPGILTYKLDRFARNGPDGYELIRLGETGLIIDGPNSGRINLRTAQGRKVFRDAISAAEFESDNTSERARDALAERIANGLQLGGGRLYGFEVLSEVREYYDDVEPVQRPAEAEVIREAARRMLDGEPLYKIAADFNERGLLTVRGKKWSGGTLRAVVGAPRNGGWVVAHGKIVGRNKGEPILEPGTYAEVQAMLGRRKRGRRASGQFPLTGVLVCGNPAHKPRTMAGHGHVNAAGDRVRDYICAVSGGGCGSTVIAKPVEDMVKARVLADAADSDEMARIAAETRQLTTARDEASAEVDRLDGLLADLEVRRVNEVIREAAYEASKTALDKRMSKALARLAEAEKATAGTGDGEVPPLTGEEYDHMTAEEKRSVIRRLRLEITVLPRPADAPKNAFDPRRVDIRP